MRMLLLTLAVCCAAASAPRAAEVPIGHHMIDMPLPAGHCAVTESSKPERIVLETMSRMQPKQLIVLLLAADCSELRALREGKRARFDRYVMYLKERQTVANRPTLTRADYVRQIAGEVPKLDVQELESEINRMTARAGVNVNVQQAALLEQADDAVYVGLLLAAGPTRVAAVSATTLVHGEGLSVSFYRMNGGSGAYGAMLREAKALVRDILAAEQGLPAAAMPAAPRWSLATLDPMIVAGGAGLAICAVVLLIGAAILRRD